MPVSNCPFYWLHLDLTNCKVNKMVPVYSVFRHWNSTAKYFILLNSLKALGTTLVNQLLSQTTWAQFGCSSGKITFPTGNFKPAFALRRQKELNCECVGMSCQVALVSESSLITFNALLQLYPLPCEAPSKEIITNGSWKRSCYTTNVNK